MLDGTEVYRVRWRGFGDADDTWEPIESFTDPTLVAEFNDRWARLTVRHACDLTASADALAAISLSCAPCTLNGIWNDGQGSARPKTRSSQNLSTTAAQRSREATTMPRRNVTPGRRSSDLRRATAI